MTESTYIIAEAGVNHNGSLKLAKQLVDVAKKAGADAVKFQTFKAENLVTRSAKQATYQVDNLGEETSQFEMLKSLELSYDEFIELKKYCDSVYIEFLSTPFDIESVDFLLNELDMEKIKIPSGELTNSPLIHYIATRRKPIILSTGMATLEEIHEALAFIADGLSTIDKPVEINAVKEFYETEEAKVLLKLYVTVLHCTTEYPAPLETIQLNAMNMLKNELGLPIGFSDHSEGIAIPIASVAMGSTVVEKHFTLDCSLSGPDHRASLEPTELKDMIDGIRAVERAMGNQDKTPSKVELENRSAARKCIVAKQSIVTGEMITENHLTTKRPGNGMSPSSYWSLIGKTSTKSYEVDDLIDE